MRNIVYKTDQIARYFAHHRIAWDQFYASERGIVDQLGLGRHQEVLDIGCGCGGLGLALRDRFELENYTGVEINASAAEAARTMNPKARILCGDILDLSQAELGGKRFDVVFSLSCIDWNVQFSAMLAAAWNHVLEGGHLVSTFRLTAEEGCPDLGQFHQFINFDGVLEGERAPYVVVNARYLINHLLSFNPSEIKSYGYWGAPSRTAVTPYGRLCFAAFSIRRRVSNCEGTPHCQLNLPKEILDAMGQSS